MKLACIENVRLERSEHCGFCFVLVVAKKDMVSKFKIRA